MVPVYHVRGKGSRCEEDKVILASGVVPVYLCLGGRGGEDGGEGGGSRGEAGTVDPGGEGGRMGGAAAGVRQAQ